MGKAAGTFSARSVLDTVASVALIAAALTLVYRNVITPSGAAQPEIDLPAEPLDIQGAPVRGASTADTVMVVFSDFQCPFCARFTREVLPEIERRYVTTGRVALVFRHLPRLTACQSDEAVSARVRASADEAGALGIRGTPAFLLGKRIDDGQVQVVRTVSGARPLEDFVTHLDAALEGRPAGWRSWVPFAG